MSSIEFDTNVSTNGIKIDAIETFEVNSVDVALISMMNTSINSLFPNAKNFNCAPIHNERPEL